MAKFHPSDLETATGILRARLSTRMPRGINLVSPLTAEQPANLNDHPGRFVGFFFMLPNGDPSFVWLSRTLPEAFGFSHVHIYYLNTNYEKVQDSEKKRFTKKGLPPHVEFCVINLKCSLPRFLNISVLIQALEVTLFSAELSLKKVHHVGVNAALCFEGTGTFPKRSSCEPLEDITVRPIWKDLGKLRYSWVQAKRGDPPLTGPVTWDVMKYTDTQLDHSVYIVNFKLAKVVMMLIPHSYIYPPKYNFRETLAFVYESMKESKPKGISPIRYYGSHGLKCNEDEVLRACLVALRFPLATIKQCDVDQLIDESFFDRMATVENPASQFSTSQESLTAVNPNYNCSQDFRSDGYVEYSQLGEGSLLRGDTANMNIVAPELSTQSTEIVDPQDSLTELCKMRAQQDLKEDLMELSIPPIVLSTPYDDPQGNCLNNKTVFFEHLTSYVNLWQAYTDVCILKPISWELPGVNIIATQPYRFVVQPVIRQSLVMVVILDRKNKEWAYLDPFFGKRQVFNNIAESF